MKVTRLDDACGDPRLVEMYALENKRGADTDFYLDLAAELAARRIVDLGCGTGDLTRELATAGREVFGVDPAAAMLDFARGQSGAEHVTWIEGDAGALGARDADLVVMTGNVAQVFVSDDEWLATLTAIHAALRPGGRVAFESRNPDDRAWQRWTKAATHRRFDSADGPVESWVEVVEVADGLVRFDASNVFHRAGETLVVGSELRFRTGDDLKRSLMASGFAVEHLYGDWTKGPIDPASRLMVFVARRLGE